MWSSILNNVLGMASDWFAARRARSQARLEADIQIERSRAQADVDWDTIQAQNSGTSWKDEWWTLVLSAPLIAIFIPGLQPYVMDGFASLQDVPEWYLAVVALAVSAAFGYRALVQPFMERMTGRNRQTSAGPSETS